MTEILRAVAKKMLGRMIHEEAEEWLARRAHLRDEQDRVRPVCAAPCLDRATSD